MSKQKARQDPLDPVRGPVFSVRFVVALVLIAVGIGSTVREALGLVLRLRMEAIRDAFRRAP